jgi:hypothetical protein
VTCGIVGADLAEYQYQQPSVALGTNVELPGASPEEYWTGGILQLPWIYIDIIPTYLDTRCSSVSRSISRLKSEVDNI